MNGHDLRWGRTSRLKFAWMRVVGSVFNFKLGHLSIGAMVICTSLVADGRDKYLAAAGPTPIRFIVAPPQLDPAEALPPLRMSDPQAGSDAALGPREPGEFLGPEVPIMNENADDQAAASTEIVPTPPFTPAIHIELTPKQNPQNPASQISPQMLLRYFNRNGTNEVLVPYPVEFTPPVPSGGGGSSAVYNSPPAK